MLLEYSFIASEHPEEGGCPSLGWLMNVLVMLVDPPVDDRGPSISELKTCYFLTGKNFLLQYQGATPPKCL